MTKSATDPLKLMHPKEMKRDLRDAVKKRIRELERKNFDKIYLYWNGGDFYRIVGNSMLIYYFEVAKVLKLSAEIMADNDYGKVCFADGMISFCGVSHICTRLEKIDLLKSRTISKDGTIVTLQLKKVYTEADIKIMSETLAEERRRIGADLKPLISHPDLYARLRFLEKRSSDMLAKLKEFKRQLVGYNFAKLGHSLTVTYLMMEQEMLPIEEGWHKIYEAIQLMQIELVSGVELRFWEQAESARVARSLIETRDAVRKLMMKERIMNKGYRPEKIRKERTEALKSMLMEKEG